MEIKYISLEGLQLYTSDVKDYIIKQIKNNKNPIVINADSYLQFPTVGDSQCLYVDTTDNKCYRWDDTNLKYFVVGSDYNDIQIIDGTGR